MLPSCTKTIANRPPSFPNGLYNVINIRKITIGIGKPKKMRLWRNFPATFEYVFHSENSLAYAKNPVFFVRLRRAFS